MWLEDAGLWPAAVRKYTEAGYNNFQFTEYSSSPDHWETRHSPNYPLPQSGLSSNLIDFASPPAHGGASSERLPNIALLSPATADLMRPNKKIPMQWLKLKMSAFDCWRQIVQLLTYKLKPNAKVVLQYLLLQLQEPLLHLGDQ